ncbi:MULTISPECIES: CDP-diacylglycerol diphosphatase [unclassified Sinorhizobium]|uniref:CDP-diacylglycerol diphosphatase n=1 Tax=unclassified Sinorhizobium TaxID=2613772 RepID=UPI003524A4DA
MAWQQRGILSASFGRSIPDSRIILAINSEYGRTQDWLHVHMSCVLDTVRKRIDAVDQNNPPFWKPVAGGVLGHDYWIRPTTAQELHEFGPFKLLSDGIAGAGEDMGKFSLAMTISQSGDFILLATRRNLLNLNLGSAEELQDHDCRGLPPSEDKSATG